MGARILLQKAVILILVVSCTLTYLSAQSYCGSTPVAVHGDLSVTGTQIVDQNNNPVSFAGNSFFWSNTGWGGEKYYNADVVSWLKQDWGTPIVRAAMGVEENGGYISDPIGNKNRIKAVVDAAITNDMYVIIDWHSHHAENHQAAAISFFQEMAQTYGNYPNVIYEIYNEPLQISWSNTIKPYSEAVINAIRAIDPDNLIIVGTPTWSQDVDVASNDPIIGHSNIAYALHFYAGTHKAFLRQKAQTALNNGIALVVTEWGTVNANGDGAVDNASTDAWMAFLEANDITHLNWSMNDKVEGASVLAPGASTAGGWSASDLTTSGTKVKNIVENWQQYCTGNGGTNNPPSVSITNPSNNSNHADGTTLSVSANVSDNDGTISSVEFFANGTSLGTDNSVPYSINWTPSSGNYHITAIATDNDGASTTSAPVSVTINSDGTGGGSLAYPNGIPHAIPGLINATHYDTGGLGISYSDTSPGNNGDGPRPNEDVDTEYRTVKGNVGWIDAGEWLEFTVDIQTSGLYNITYQVASEDNGQFRLEFDGQDVTGTVDVDATGGWGDFTTITSQDIPLNSGQQTMLLYFIQGPFNIADIIFEAASSNPNQPPSVTVTTPSNNSNFDENTTISIAVDASDSDGTVSFVEFFVNGISLGTDNSAPYSINWTPSIGNYAITATAIDNDGTLTTSPPVVVTINSNDNPGGDNTPCDNPISISLPFAHDGSGIYCWEITGTINYVNSWATEAIRINGLDYTNVWSNNLPTPIDGKYYIEYEGNLGWSHFEADRTSTTNGAGIYENNNRIAANTSRKIEKNAGIDLYPNPVINVLNIKIDNPASYEEISVIDPLGKTFLRQRINSAETLQIPLNNINNGVYFLKLFGKETTIVKTFIRGT